MPNTVTQKTLYGDATTKKVVRSIHIASDGTEETDLVIYDNSAFVADVTKGKLLRVIVSGSFTGSAVLEWDQTADSPIVAVGQGDRKLCFESFGGIQNPGAAGATGDIVLTTRALAALDDLHLIIEIDQS